MDQMIPDRNPPRFVVCLRNDGYELDLALHKRYEVLPDPSAERSGWIRIVDETGDDYLYPEKYFQAVDTPATASAAMQDTDDQELRMRQGAASSAESRFAVCVCNDGYPAALELHRVYPMIPDAQAEQHGLVRIVDESREACLYPQEFFHPVDLPEGIGRALPMRGNDADCEPNR